MINIHNTLPSTNRVTAMPFYRHSRYEKYSL